MRAHARRLGLPVADKPDSQEICFVPDGDYASFVERHVAAMPRSGGVIASTDGQRARAPRRRPSLHGRAAQGLAALIDRAAVRRRDRARPSAVSSSGRREDARARRTARVGEVNWIAGEPPSAGVSVGVQIRHRHRRCARDGDRARWRPGARRLRSSPSAPSRPDRRQCSTTGTRLLGGGWIDRVGEVLSTESASCKPARRTHSWAATAFLAVCSRCAACSR